jgi:hypothetical protein
VRSRLVLLLVVSCCLSRAVAQDGTCETFETDSPQCVAPCVGSPLIKNMIVGSVGTGVYHIEYQTFICSSSAKGNSCASTAHFSAWGAAGEETTRPSSAMTARSGLGSASDTNPGAAGSEGKCLSVTSQFFLPGRKPFLAN